MCITARKLCTHKVCGKQPRASPALNFSTSTEEPKSVKTVACSKTTVLVDRDAKRQMTVCNAGRVLACGAN